MNNTNNIKYCIYNSNMGALIATVKKQFQHHVDLEIDPNINHNINIIIDYTTNSSH